MYLAQREAPVPNWEAFSTSYRNVADGQKIVLFVQKAGIRLQDRQDRDYGIFIT